jgi:GNAT superfamily N-acetyltransferase
VHASTPSDRDLEAAEVAACLDAWRAAPAGSSPRTASRRRRSPAGPASPWPRSRNRGPFGATRPEHRGRGAQGAILAGRIERARDLGLRWLVTETGAPRQDGPGSSYRNILRAGFREIEVRPNLASPPPTT